MNKTLRITVMAGWIGIIGLGKMGKSATVDVDDTNMRIAVHVRNYARVEENVLEQAGKIATRIFQQAGVEAVVGVETENEGLNTVDATIPRLCHLYVDILPREMANRFRLPRNVLGQAPGTFLGHGPVVYVFNQVADELVREQKEADKAHILAHAMAHEIGHILLHMAQHSHDGIMKANWNRNDMREMTTNGLAFSPEEVTRIQAEVAEVTRRSQRQTLVEIAAKR